MGNTYSEHKSLHKYTRVPRGQEHDSSDASEEGYAVLCAGCEGSKGNGTRQLRSPCCTV